MKTLYFVSMCYYMVRRRSIKSSNRYPFSNHIDVHRASIHFNTLRPASTDFWLGLKTQCTLASYFWKLKTRDGRWHAGRKELTPQYCYYTIVVAAYRWYHENWVSVTLSKLLRSTLVVDRSISEGWSQKTANSAVAVLRSSSPRQRNRIFMTTNNWHKWKHTLDNHHTRR